MKWAVVALILTVGLATIFIYTPYVLITNGHWEIAAVLYGTVVGTLLLLGFAEWFDDRRRI